MATTLWGLLKIFGWEPILLAVLAFGILFISLVVFLVYAAARYKMPIETKFTPFFNLRVGGAASPTSSSKDPSVRAPIDREVPPFATELRELCLQRKIRKRDLARLLNVTASFISEIEAGRKLLTPDQLERIINEFGVAERQAKKLRRALRRSAAKDK
jgi:hypothetical protein